MAREKIDPQVRSVIRAAQKMIKELQQQDGNEAETRRRVERMLESLMGYDAFKHITREHAISAVGDANYCDFAIVLDDKPPKVIIELKRIGLELQKKHLKQAAHYAIDCGCEWIVLTNGKDWELYHIAYGQPPETRRLESWDLLEDDVVALAKMFELIGYRSVSRGDLDNLWQKRNVLTAKNFLKIILNEDGLRRLRRELKQSTGVAVSHEEIVAGIRRMLNDAAGSDMAALRITLPERKRRTRKKEKEESQDSKPGDAPSIPPVHEQPQQVPPPGVVSPEKDVR